MQADSPFAERQGIDVAVSFLPCRVEGIGREGKIPFGSVRALFTQCQRQRHLRARSCPSLRSHQPVGHCNGARGAHLLRTGRWGKRDFTHRSQSGQSAIRQGHRAGRSGSGSSRTVERSSAARCRKLNLLYIIVCRIRGAVVRVLNAEHDLRQGVLQIEGRRSRQAVGGNRRSRTYGSAAGTVKIIGGRAVVGISSVEGLPGRHANGESRQDSTAATAAATTVASATTAAIALQGCRSGCPGIDRCFCKADVGRRSARPIDTGSRFREGRSPGVAARIETAVRSGEVDANGADPVCTRTNIVDHATGGSERGTGMNTGLQEDGIAVGEDGVLTGTGYAKQGCGPKEQKNEYVLHLLSC